MGNSLLTYLNKRVTKVNHPDSLGKPPGPVITISREVGCSGLDMAYALQYRLNNSQYFDSWKVLSKEIFQESAKELDLDPEQVSRIFKQVDRTTFDEILHAFGEKRFKSDKKIRNTVIEVMRGFAEDGFCIIVGRASNVIAADIRNSLHIRLVAPLEFRINSIMKKNNLDHENAAKFIINEERDRYTYRQAVVEKQHDQPEIFDITFNSAEFSREDIVEFIMLMIEKKGILNDYRKKMEFF
jgi:cytidylate kinase